MADQRQEPTDLAAISVLGFLLDHIAMVAQQKATLERGLAKPYVLDNDTVTRVKTVFSQTAADNELFAEQRRRWAAEPGLTSDQRSEVERYQELVEQITAETNAVLVIADQPAGVTIETLMTKSHLEVGIAAAAEFDPCRMVRSSWRWAQAVKEHKAERVPVRGGGRMRGPVTVIRRVKGSV